VQRLLATLPDVQPTERGWEVITEDTRHHDALMSVSGAGMHLVQQWAEVSDDGRNYLVANLAKSLRNLEYVEAKLGLNIDGQPDGDSNGQT
jgi:hypothetical protein